jgi:uncharacterized membrane protein YhaH (DUF805 family)
MPDYLTLLTSPKGRIGRQTFWILAIGLIAASMIVSIVPLIGALASMALLWPWTCLSVKRLHDMDRPGALAFIPLSVGLVSGALAFLSALLALNPLIMLSTLAVAGVTALAGLAALLISLVFVLWIGLSPGRPTANAHGLPEVEPLSLQTILGPKRAA